MFKGFSKKPLISCKKALITHSIVIISTLFLCGCGAATMQEFKDATNKVMQDAKDAMAEAKISNSTGNKLEEVAGLKKSGIYDIFVDAPYDESRKGNPQWPRVAIDVISSPDNIDAYYAVGLSNFPNGCFTMQATIWKAKTSKRKTEPFEFCSPNDIAFDTPLQTYVDWASRWSFTTTFRKNSGNVRTNSLPPNSFAPGNIKYQRKFKNSFVYGKSYGVGSFLGLMLFSVAAHAGIDPSISADHRIWFTKIAPLE